MSKKVCGCLDEYLDDVLEDEDDDFCDTDDCENDNQWIKTDHQKIEEILDECKVILRAKGHEYNHGGIKMGDYYPRGVYSAIDVMYSKMLRLYSLLHTERIEHSENIEDSAKSLINYTAIFIGIFRGLIETPVEKD